jgi:hydrogenase nickel incorporation protein HypA/HybF
MHELSVTENILAIVIGHIPKGTPARVKNVYLVLGQLSTIIDDSVEFYWDFVSKDTPAEGAKLHFKRIEAELQCLKCETRYKLHEDDFACPNCGSTEIKVIAGEEFLVEAIDISN